MASVHCFGAGLCDPAAGPRWLHPLSWNRAAELISRYEAHEIVGQHLACLYPSKDVATGKPERELRTAAATGHLADVSERRRKDGSCFLASVQLTAIRGPDDSLRDFGQIIGNLDMLRETRAGDPVTDELVRDALESALRGADLTPRLLAFARRQALQPEQADVNEVIGAIVRLLTRTLGENISIELALSSNV